MYVAGFQGVVNTGLVYVLMGMGVTGAGPTGGGTEYIVLFGGSKQVKFM